MPTGTIRHITVVFVVTVFAASLLVPNAAACGSDKLARLTQGTSMAALPLAGTRPGLSIAGLSAAGSVTPSPGTTPVSHTVVGLWDVKDYAGGALFAEYYDTWHSDGNELYIDASNPALDNVCQGIWKQVSPNTYKLKHVAWWFDNSGNLLGWGVFHDVVELAKDGNSFTGTEHIFLYDTNGILLGEQDGDVLQATRITVDF